MPIPPKQIAGRGEAHATLTTPTMWFSDMPIPKNAKWLSTGDPIALELYARVMAGLQIALKTLKPGRTYKAAYFVGHDVWEDLNRGDKSRAGRCLADLVRSDEFPIEMVQRPAGASTKRYRIRWTPPAPPAISTKKTVSAASIKVPGFAQANASPALAKTLHS